MSNIDILKHSLVRVKNMSNLKQFIDKIATLNNLFFFVNVKDIVVDPNDDHIFVNLEFEEILKTLKTMGKIDRVVFISTKTHRCSITVYEQLFSLIGYQGWHLRMTDGEKNIESVIKSFIDKSKEFNTLDRKYVLYLDSNKTNSVNVLQKLTNELDDAMFMSLYYESETLYRRMFSFFMRTDECISI